MGFVSKRTSDISGQIIDDDQVITVVVRSLNKKFDATGEELAGLKRLTNVIEVELQHPDGREEEIIVNKAEFDKIVTDEVLQRTDTVRRRRPLQRRNRPPSQLPSIRLDLSNYLNQVG
jgi:hypothetical protein